MTILTGNLLIAIVILLLNSVESRPSSSGGKGNLLAPDASGGKGKLAIENESESPFKLTMTELKDAKTELIISSRDPVSNIVHKVCLNFPKGVKPDISSLNVQPANVASQRKQGSNPSSSGGRGKLAQPNSSKPPFELTVNKLEDERTEIIISSRDPMSDIVHRVCLSFPKGVKPDVSSLSVKPARVAPQMKASGKFFPWSRK